MAANVVVAVAVDDPGRHLDVVDQARHRAQVDNAALTNLVHADRGGRRIVRAVGGEGVHVPVLGVIRQAVEQNAQIVGRATGHDVHRHRVVGGRRTVDPEQARSGAHLSDLKENPVAGKGRPLRPRLIWQKSQQRKQPDA
ncbi:hypothetical protein [Hymenobacter ruricola]|uniref:hypothetical protein n=1 Tax=Hymenobacter ruricola TaxID=2791023 RepID=UPI0037448F01